MSSSSSMDSSGSGSSDDYYYPGLDQLTVVNIVNGLSVAVASLALLAHLAMRLTYPKEMNKLVLKLSLGILVSEVIYHVSILDMILYACDDKRSLRARISGPRSHTTIYSHQTTRDCVRSSVVYYTSCRLCSQLYTAAQSSCIITRSSYYNGNTRHHGIQSCYGDRL